jgi:hypothetical protein
MAQRAYVLLQTDGTPIKAVESDLRTVPGVISAQLLRGQYAAIALITSDRGEPLGKVVTRIRQIQGVVRAVVAPLVSHVAPRTLRKTHSVGSASDPHRRRSRQMSLPGQSGAMSFHSR